MASSTRRSHTVTDGFTVEETAELEEFGHLRNQPGVAELHNRWVFHPASKLLFAWELFSMVLLLYTAVVLPFRVAFDDRLGRWDWSSPLTWFDIMVDVFFLLDIVRNARTAYFDHNTGILESEPSKLVRHYAKTWLVLDLVASFPLDWFLTSDEFDRGGLLLLLRLVKLGKLLRLVRLMRVSLLTRITGESLELLTALLQWDGIWYVRQLVVLLFLVHWNACLQYFVALSNDFPVESWTVRGGVQELDSMGERYSASALHATSQMFAVSVGVVPPVRSEERWLAVGSILAGVSLLSRYLASAFTALLDSQAESSRAYQDKINMLNQWMKFSELNQELRQKLRRYFQMYYPGGHAFDERAIMSELSRPLREKVTELMFKQVLEQMDIPELEKSDQRAQGLTAELAMALRRQIFLKGDYLIRQDEEVSGMLLVSEGALEIRLREASEQEKVLKTLNRANKGVIVGEVSLLEPGSMATASVVAATHCEASQLSREAFNQLTARYDVLHAAVRKLSLKRRLEIAVEDCDASKIRTVLIELSEVTSDAFWDVTLRTAQLQLHQLDLKFSMQIVDNAVLETADSLPLAGSGSILDELCGMGAPRR